MSAIIFELTTDCTCVVFDDDENQIEADTCYGCYDDALENLRCELEHWQTVNGFDDATLIRLEASGLGWRRRAGYRDIRADEITGALTLNGDYRIHFSFTPDYKTLTARRYSHDEPTGTGEIVFAKSPLEACDYCGEPAECQDLVSEYATERACTDCAEVHK
jgi:hypothetical protein